MEFPDSLRLYSVLRIHGIYVFKYSPTVEPEIVMIGDIGWPDRGAK